jgi:MoxR-like ATPase
VERNVITQEMAARIRAEAGRVLVGQESTFDLLLIALLSGGHVLLEGPPGTAKTLMAKTLAELTQAEFRRVQFTPDLMPSDVVGTQVFELNTGEFRLRRGPIFTQVLLGDEINRAPAKTQSALLEAMEERQVTIEGERLPLPDPFFVVATQNPIEYEGTYPLPEAQLDRFLSSCWSAMPHRRLSLSCCAATRPASTPVASRTWA